MRTKGQECLVTLCSAVDSTIMSHKCVNFYQAFKLLESATVSAISRFWQRVWDLHSHRNCCCFLIPEITLAKYITEKTEGQVESCELGSSVGSFLPNC